MRLHLSSYRIPVPEALFGLLDAPPTESTVAIIPNAKDYKIPEERANSLDELIVYLGGFGFKSEVIDLRDYEDPAVLREKLQPHRVIWAAGGNSFMLRYEMNRTKLDTFLGELLTDGTVYCGESAGAIVAGLTLEGSEVADEPELADRYIGEGLGLVDSIIAPHADSPEFFAYIHAMRNRYKDDDRVLYLNDDQALIINGTQQSIVGAS